MPHKLSRLNRHRNITTTHVAEGLPEMDELQQEFDDMVDVLNGHELADLELGELTLLELATAYFGRACEVEMILHRGEADGSVLRNSSAYRFRTGELRDFKELCKAKMKLGQTRVYWAQQDMEPNLANVLGFGDDDD